MVITVFQSGFQTDYRNGWNWAGIRHGIFCEALKQSKNILVNRL